MKADEIVKIMVDRFLSWPLPQSVAADLCATDPNYLHSRTGTNLLTADQAREMFEACAIDIVTDCERSVRAMADQIEVLRMQLVACGVAAGQNTVTSRKERVSVGNPYWSPSYADVCAAVDREIELREKLEAAQGAAAT